ncbi:MAG TPA: hypothetical protein VKX49_12875 [Bryobacteraceae bacterium]|nr:hypothetical protein [Bryobacteraceae bacterium]
MRVNVINLSVPHYNLGAAKLAAWLRSQGWTVVEQGLGEADLVCLSAIFSWDLPKGVRIVAHYDGRAEIWAGGPGFHHMAEWWKEQTGITAHIGLDWRFERHRGDYRMCFAARGCPWDCHFCGVTKWEGKEYTLDWDFEPAPILCDNNLTDEPVDFQEHIVRRYQERGVRLLDANSGFEPRNFTEETYRRWKALLRGPWRFAYDYLPERSAALRVLRILRDEPSKKKRVYVLIGNEPFEACLQRATEVIENGGEPYCQPFLPKTALDRHDFVIRYDWTRDKLVHFARYFNRHLNKYSTLEEYRCATKQPFAMLS